MENNNLPDSKDLANNLGKIAYSLDKAYMSCLKKDYKVLPFKDYLTTVGNNGGELKINSNIRALQVKRWVYDTDELIRDGFKNVLGLFSAGVHNVALIIRRSPAKVEMFFAVKNELASKKPAESNITLFRDSIYGNFNGTKIETENIDTDALLNFDNTKAISVLCGIPSEKSENYISQGIEKLLNGIVPCNDEDSYTCVILAQPLSITELRDILSNYETIASALSPFAGKQVQFGNSKTDTSGEMNSNARSRGLSYAETANHSLGVSVSATVGVPGSGVSIGGNYGYNLGKSNTINTNDVMTVGTNTSLAISDSENTTFSHKSYMVSDLIDKLELTIKRINESQATGLWRTAIYVMSEKIGVSTNAANFLNSIMQGESSYIEPPFIQTYYNHEPDDFKNIVQYVRHLTHPIFNNKLDNVQILPTANVSTLELSNLFSFPRYSVQGLPVVECARFGREPHSLIELKKDITLGTAYHMHTLEPHNRIFISKDELTKHTFITGSTGSGKSNTIYKMIEELCPEGNCDTNFLVIEPAKGEYKDTFGGREDVTVYGTNPSKAPNLLRINPFSFPDDVYVREHIDRLVEVFNACWPMYAAMPEILKEAVEMAYEQCGWNLNSPKNIGVYPNFDTLLSVLPQVVDKSAYSADTSNDYKGALITRVRSLTRGIHGQIFSGDIPGDDLFNSNAIVDISLVGASDTKALIMGILILKIQEFRMSEKIKHNSGLRHVTILEEAHNLLRQTSNIQSRESANVQGKSVEMIANAIAEMRTYGEGFIIADQSPGLMDMSVIRNTNTKIILRLPDEGDRMLVGKAAGLNDSQIIELSRLERGVAAISQSDWLEPVLCMVDQFENPKSLESKFHTTTFEWNDNESAFVKQFLNAALDIEKNKLTKDVVDKVRKWYGSLEMSTKSMYLFERVIEGTHLSGEEKILMIHKIIGNKLNKIYKRNEVIDEVSNTLVNKYDINIDNEIIYRINELFTRYFPENAIFNNASEPTELFNTGEKMI